MSLCLSVNFALPYLFLPEIPSCSDVPQRCGLAPHRDLTGINYGGPRVATPSFEHFHAAELLPAKGAVSSVCENYSAVRCPVMNDGWRLGRRFH